MSSRRQCEEGRDDDAFMDSFGITLDTCVTCVVNEYNLLKRCVCYCRGSLLRVHYAGEVNELRAQY